MRSRGGMLGVLFVIPLLLTGCGGGKAQQVERGSERGADNTSAITISSADPLVNLEIETIPKGVKKSDMSITAIDPVEHGVTQEQMDEMGMQGFDLLPGGIEFDESAVMTFRYPDGLENGLPLYVHVHNGQARIVDGVQFTMDGEESIARVPINGFSKLFVWKIGPNVMDVEFVGTDVKVGEYIPLSVKVTLHDAPTDQFRLQHKLLPDTSKLVGGFKTYSLNISPSDLEGRPPMTKVDDTYTLHVNDYFKCVREGAGRIDYTAKLTYRADVVMPGVSFMWTDVTTENQEKWTEITTPIEINCIKNPDPIIEPPKARCGDGRINQAFESCDMQDLGRKNCRDYGYAYGLLTCTESCDIDYRGCSSPIQKISCSGNTRESYNEYTETQGAKMCSNDCPERQKCDPDSCTCMSYEERSEKVYGTVNMDRFLHPEKYPAIPTTKTIKVIKYGMDHIPVDQVHEGQGEECDKVKHWHASGPVTTLMGMQTRDPDGGGCGFGKLSENPVFEMEVKLTQEEIEVIIAAQDAAAQVADVAREVVQEIADDSEILPGMDD